MAYDPLKLCLDKGEYFEVDPAKMFPATLKRIDSVNKKNELAPEIYGGNQTALMEFLKRAKDFNEADLALETDKRPAVLAFAESWFTRALILAADEKKKIVILKDDEYKRS